MKFPQKSCQFSLHSIKKKRQKCEKKTAKIFNESFRYFYFGPRRMFATEEGEDTHHVAVQSEIHVKESPKQEDQGILWRG